MNTNYKEIDEQFKAKYGVTFEVLSKRLEDNSGTIEEEDDWLEWEAALNMMNAGDGRGEGVDIYERALSQWGIEAQRMMLIEEMGEVMQAMSHEFRGRCDMEKVASELVDLQVVLNSVKLHYTNEAEWNEIMTEAEEGLERRLNQRGR